MNKTSFLKVLQHYSGSSTEEAEAVLSLKEYFPFSQVLHTLSARVSKDHGFSNQQSELQLAAIYAADRTVLKDIMAAEFNPSDETDDHDSGNARQFNASFVSSEAPSSEDLAKNVIDHLQQLHDLRHNFEKLFMDGSIAQIQTSAIAIEQMEETGIPVIESAKSKKQRIIELAKTVEETAPAVKSRRKKTSVDAFIDEIAVTKEELSLENEKQKEQLEIIENFIRSHPSISNAKDKQLNADDLTTTNTGEFSENIVSETLVEILVKQGKKDKAIEVLKKLIWKFPQKKVYFAAQIEELRK